MYDDWAPYPGGVDAASLSAYPHQDPFDHPYYWNREENPERDAAWAALTLKQKIVGSICSIAVGAAGASLLIALVQILH